MRLNSPAKVARPLFVLCLGSVWVLMLTTAGPTRWAILTNSLGGTVELTTLRGVASELSFCFSCPRTPWAAKEPATIAIDKVASKTNTEVRRRARSRSINDFMGSLTSFDNQPCGWLVQKMLIAPVHLDRLVLWVPILFGFFAKRAG